MFEVIWFLLLFLLWAVYFALDGFDMGLGMLLPFAATNEGHRRIVYNAAGPFWDGNEVWLISAGGVTFAAFPKTYAYMFSVLYVPLLLLLFCLILRAVSFEFRNKIDSQFWRGLWDTVHFVTNLVAALLLGVAFANLFAGVPFDASGVLHGSLFSFLSLYALVGGLFFVSAFALHGALWLCWRTGSECLQDRTLCFINLLWPATLLLLLAFLFLTPYNTDLFKNYFASPYLALFLIPVVALIAFFAVPALLAKQKVLAAWGANCVFIIGIVFFGAMGMFPRLLISSHDSAATLTAFNSASSPLTLKIMLVVAIIMVPIVLAYQFWAYRLFSHKLDPDEIMEDEHAY